MLYHKSTEVCCASDGARKISRAVIETTSVQTVSGAFTNAQAAENCFVDKDTVGANVEQIAVNGNYTT